MRGIYQMVGLLKGYIHTEIELEDVDMDIDAYIDIEYDIELERKSKQSATVPYGSPLG